MLSNIFHGSCSLISAFFELFLHFQKLSVMQLFQTREFDLKSYTTYEDEMKITCEEALIDPSSLESCPRSLSSLITNSTKGFQDWIQDYRCTLMCLCLLVKFLRKQSDLVFCLVSNGRHLLFVQELLIVKLYREFVDVVFQLLYLVCLDGDLISL